MPEKAKLPPARKEEFADIHKAARETQYRMGIAKPNGEVFRLPAKESDAALALRDGIPFSLTRFRRRASVPWCGD